MEYKVNNSYLHVGSVRGVSSEKGYRFDERWRGYLSLVKAIPLLAAIQPTVDTNNGSKEHEWLLVLSNRVTEHQRSREKHEKLLGFWHAHILMRTPCIQNTPGP